MILGGYERLVPNIHSALLVGLPTRRRWKFQNGIYRTPLQLGSECDFYLKAEVR